MRNVLGKDEAFRGVLCARIAELRARDREALMHAALFGRRFDVPLLAVVVGRPPQRLLRGLAHACRLQIIAQVEAGADPSEWPTYEFRHALVRDAICRELVSQRLRPFHRKIAAALERLADSHDAFGAKRAYHWWAAGDAERARTYNEMAGDGALAVHATDGARSYYERALELLPRGHPERVRLEGKLDALAVYGAVTPKSR